MRIYDALLAYEAVKVLTEDEPTVDMVEWVADPDNIFLVNECGDLSLFEHHENAKVVTGHYYFKSRGKRAVQSAKDFLTEVFYLGVQAIVGKTPIRNLGARWMSRHLGFTSYGVVQTFKEPCELFIMHHTEFTR